MATWVYLCLDYVACQRRVVTWLCLHAFPYTHSASSLGCAKRRCTRLQHVTCLVMAQAARTPLVTDMPLLLACSTLYYAIVMHTRVTAVASAAPAVPLLATSQSSAPRTYNASLTAPWTLRAAAKLLFQSRNAVCRLCTPQAQPPQSLQPAPPPPRLANHVYLGCRPRWGASHTLSAFVAVGLLGQWRGLS